MNVLHSCTCRWYWAADMHTETHKDSSTSQTENCTVMNKCDIEDNIRTCPPKQDPGSAQPYIQHSSSTPLPADDILYQDFRPVQAWSLENPVVLTSGDWVTYGGQV